MAEEDWAAFVAYMKTHGTAGEGTSEFPYDDEVAHTLLTFSAPLSQEPEATHGGPKMSATWTLEEDLCLCRSVVERGGLNCQKLSARWLQANLQPFPEGLAKRQMGAIVLRFNYLREELVEHLNRSSNRKDTDDASWDWLFEKHMHPSRVLPYTFDEDMAICQKVLDMNMVHEQLGQKFFREHVEGRVPVLQGRSASGLYARYAKCLKKRLRAAISQGGSFQWLKDMHNTVINQSETATPRGEK